MFPEFPELNFRQLYDRFDAPIADLDCGQICAQQNPNGVPFCCDICHAVPAGFITEWDFLRERTDLWHIWRGGDRDCDTSDPEALWDETPDHMLLMACKGVAFCERDNRAVSCRQFPFFPYITSSGAFIGLAYEWHFEEQCWLISNLPRVTQAYREEFVALYDELLQIEAEKESYQVLSDQMRDVFKDNGRKIVLLHRADGFVKIDPNDERTVVVAPSGLPRFGPYRVGE